MNSAARGIVGKLVLVPALAVLVMVTVAMMFGRLTLAPDDPDSLLRSLRDGGNQRWHAAVSLAGLLRAPEGEPLKRDRIFAAELGRILQEQLDAGSLEPKEITLRVYLCRALGEFRILEPLDVLLEAAAVERDEREVDVRRAAIEAVALLASHVGPAQVRTDPDVLRVLSAAASGRHATVRASAAYALGVVGGEPSQQRLETLLADGHPDVRYNAATGLARHGNAKAVDVLVEMLDPHEPAGIAVEKQEAAKGFKRTLILTNALRAGGRLAERNRADDLRPLALAIERLSKANVEPAIRVKAREVQAILSRRGSTGSGRQQRGVGGEEEREAAGKDLEVE